MKAVPPPTAPAMVLVPPLSVFEELDTGTMATEGLVVGGAVGVEVGGVDVWAAVGLVVVGPVVVLVVGESTGQPGGIQHT